MLAQRAIVQLLVVGFHRTPSVKSAVEVPYTTMFIPQSTTDTAFCQVFGVCGVCALFGVRH